MQQVVATKSMKHFLSLAIPGFAACVIEWWVFEIVMFLSGLLENPEVTVAASAVATTTQAVYLMAWIGFLVAASVR
eukprot:1124657-Alexandrium_andersonii.AAC.1